MQQYPRGIKIILTGETGVYIIRNIKPKVIIITNEGIQIIEIIINSIPTE